MLAPCAASAGAAAADAELLPPEQAFRYSARALDSLTESLFTQAEQGHGAMSETVSAMAQMQEASQRVAEVVAVIDDVAFQTGNLASVSAWVTSQYPGAPVVYYGDEVGLTGGADPYNRAPYPWADQGGQPDEALRADFTRMIALRNAHPVLRRGALLAPLHAGHDLGLISEAGLPAVADPGSALVALAHAEKLVVHPYTIRTDELPKHCPSMTALHAALFRDAGADGVFTDFTDVTRAWVSAR